MYKKIVSISSIFVITILSILFFYDTSSIDKKLLADTFVVDAVYHDSDGYVEISFSDTSQKTNSVVLEILGMEDSFQKTFEGSNFVDKIPFQSVPKYGWKVHPVTLIIDHQEFGKIGLKTEIHFINDPIPPIIYSEL